MVVVIDKYAYYHIRHQLVTILGTILYTIYTVRIKLVCSIISKSVYTSLVRRLDTLRTEIYYLVISKIVII
jgi:hypothetical protein